jgi:hypothetical protein
MKRERKLPRPFEMPWGSGEIVEEAAAECEHHEPTVQLLEHSDPEHAGALTIRFCSYSLDGRFQRSPLMVGDGDIAALRAARARTPRLRALLRKLVK